MQIFIVWMLVVSLGGWTALARAQSPGGASPTAVDPAALAIDCPPDTVKDATAAPAQPMGTPSGLGSGSGISARPSEGPPQRVMGAITHLASTRTERSFRIGDVELWVQPSTAILVDCIKASTADLQQGMQVKVAYEVKDGRNVARVIEATKP